MGTQFETYTQTGYIVGEEEEGGGGGGVGKGVRVEEEGIREGTSGETELAVRTYSLFSFFSLLPMSSSSSTHSFIRQFTKSFAYPLINPPTHSPTHPLQSLAAVQNARLDTSCGLLEEGAGKKEEEEEEEEEEGKSNNNGGRKKGIFGGDGRRK